MATGHLCGRIRATKRVRSASQLSAYRPSSRRSSPTWRARAFKPSQRVPASRPYVTTTRLSTMTITTSEPRAAWTRFVTIVSATDGWTWSSYRLDNGHCASAAKNSGEKQVVASQRKAKARACEQGKRDQFPQAWRHTLLLISQKCAFLLRNVVANYPFERPRPALPVTQCYPR